MAFSISAHSGDSIVLIPVLAVLWAVDGLSLESYTLSLGAAFAGSVVVTTALKFAVRRGRPAGDWGRMYRRTDPHSFPSGHASRAVALGLAVLGHGWPLAGGLLLLWSLLVGFSRVVMGVHYLLDVAAGYLVGAGVGAAVWMLVNHGIMP
ncbi:MAG: phosphatase PAP2 family protein [Spirochaetales bacterium]|nr:phosphatase PAP2 family protein [Spirochaetales bacterium]